MKKRNMDYLVRRLFLAFFTSMCQNILFIPIFYIYLVFIPWTRIGWFLLVVPYFLIPILSAFCCCFLMHRGNFRFDSRNVASKASAYRLAARLLSVFCFLLIGYILDKNNGGVPIFVSDLLNKFGEHGSALRSLLHNFFLYMVSAIFTTVYAFAEYLFVTSKMEYSTDS
ncbi:MULTISPECIES: hypothetical protein [unclassified Sedimentibacter]|uniref:hypothetical protein n=1 Tax=unclassified Sedimentibacter TaxID=2649220 RepID=UPI0027E03772|nr:hypothetical protein [Sedimentibacter sp. MB35-C1]WMJ76518.1 hypothetical protein RBQ61_12885 [Sedimentibacter sp. MB35-C1]